MERLTEALGAPIGAVERQQIAADLTTLVNTIRRYLPVSPRGVSADAARRRKPAGVLTAQCDWATVAAEAYCRIERIRNPRELPFAERGGPTHVAGTERTCHHALALLRHLFADLDRLAIHFGWQDFSDRSAAPGYTYGSRVPTCPRPLLESLETHAAALRELVESEAAENAADTIVDDSLTPAQREILRVVRDAPSRLTTGEIVAALEHRHGAASLGTTKTNLAALVRLKQLTNDRHAKPNGYGIPDRRYIPG